MTWDVEAYLAYMLRPVYKIHQRAGTVSAVLLLLRSRPRRSTPLQAQTAAHQGKIYICAVCAKVGVQTVSANTLAVSSRAWPRPDGELVRAA